MDKLIQLKDLYFLYHAPVGAGSNTHPRNKGKGKIGITKRPRKRLAEQRLTLGKDCEIIGALSQTLPAELVGRIEWLIAEHYGYGKGNPYDERR
jgi:hypothetical protein